MTERKYDGRHCAGDLGKLDLDETELGPCPSCGAMLTVGEVLVGTAAAQRAMYHPMPFCRYYGDTDPSLIERDVLEKRTIQ
jgi:hypothetical protein